MKYLFTLIMTITFSVAAFGQAEKTIIKSIPIQAIAATFELPGETTVAEWDKEFIRITATIQVTNTTEQILARLITIRRYEFQVTEIDGEVIIQMPKMMHHIAVKGIQLEESIQFEISVPKNFDVKMVYPDYYKAQPIM